MFRIILVCVGVGAAIGVVIGVIQGVLTRGGGAARCAQVPGSGLGKALHAGTELQRPTPTCTSTTGADRTDGSLPMSSPPGTTRLGQHAVWDGDPVPGRDRSPMRSGQEALPQAARTVKRATSQRS
ncbi:MAG: hypothetical protein QOI76_405 [Frankiales bacterium]|nr:hypothetical protein [Frankiales bacterium]